MFKKQSLILCAMILISQHIAAIEDDKREDILERIDKLTNKLQQCEYRLLQMETQANTCHLPPAEREIAGRTATPIDLYKQCMEKCNRGCCGILCELGCRNTFQENVEQAKNQCDDAVKEALQHECDNLKVRIARFKKDIRQSPEE